MKKVARGIVVIALISIVGAGFGFSPDAPSADASSHDALNTDCQAEPHLISAATTAEDIAVYALDDDQSDVLGIFETGAEIAVIGRNYDGQWLVIEWNENSVGWVQLSDVEILACDNVNAPTDPAMPTAPPPN